MWGCEGVAQKFRLSSRNVSSPAMRCTAKRIVCEDCMQGPCVPRSRYGFSVTRSALHTWWHLGASMVCVD